MIPQPTPPAQHRLDKWLWTVRVFKTHSMATAACRRGRIRVAGQPAKPARTLALHEIVTVETSDLTRTLRVLAFPPRRIAAKLVAAHAEDLTPAAELERADQRRAGRRLEPASDPRVGRPTKRQRRALEDFLDKVANDRNRNRNRDP